MYFHPVTGGGYRLLTSHDARGREGDPDTFWVDPGVGGHYYVTTTDTTGNESCASPPVYVPGSVTSVPIIAESQVLKREFFNVRGQRLRERPRSAGIRYWERLTYLGPDRRVHRLVLAR